MRNRINLLHSPQLLPTVLRESSLPLNHPSLKKQARLALPWLSHIRSSEITNQVCPHFTKNARPPPRYRHAAALPMTLHLIYSDSRWPASARRCCLDVATRDKPSVTLHSYHQSPGHMLQSNRWVDTYSLIQTGGWELGVVKARRGKEWGKGMNLVLQTKGFTIDVQCWQAMVCQTSPHPHVLGQNQLCSIVWLSHSNTGWIKIEECVSRGDVWWCNGM